MLRSPFLFCALALGLISSAQLGFDPVHLQWENVLSIEADNFVDENLLSTSEDYTEVNRLIIEENWTEAEALLAQMMIGDSDNRNFAYKRALCLWSIKGRLEEAVPMVHKAIEGALSKRYNAFDVNATLPPLDALDLALDVLQFSGHFSEAQAVAMTMMERFPKRDFRHVRAKQAVDDCAFAMTCMENPTAIIVEAEAALNSSSQDMAPIVAPDGDAVYFTSYRGQEVSGAKKRGKIFRALKTSNGWAAPEALELEKSNRDMITVGWIGDEEALVVYQSSRKAGSLWTLNENNVGDWNLEEKVGFPVDSRHWETSLSERFDGRERIFVSDRPGGLGGRDIYRSVLLPDGAWSEPLNLGRRINTEGEEESPVVSADGRTLVFASNGHQGMGGFDLFRCVRLDNGSWSDPEHMGWPLNTPGDEAMLNFDVSGQTGYVSSARAGGGDMDIYRVEIQEKPKEALAVFIGEIPNWAIGDVLEVKSVDDGPSIFRVFRARSESGSFVAALPPCREYRFKWMRKNETLSTMLHFVDCDAAYGNGKEVQRLKPFGVNVNVPVVEEAEPANEGVAGMKKENPKEAEEIANGVGSLAPDVAASHSFQAPSAESTEESMADSEVSVAQENSVSSAAIKASVDLGIEARPLTMIEFDAVSTVVEFGYGRYLTESRSTEVESMVSEIASRRAVGEVPVLQIEGSASFVPVKNKRAYESNEELARMRAEKARDAMITAMSAKGLQIGVDYQIVLDWKVAGPEFKGDAVAGQEVYKTYQFAKFSLGRQLVEKRG